MVIFGFGTSGFDTGVELNLFSFAVSPRPVLKPGPESDAERIAELAMLSIILLVGIVNLRGDISPL
jgi:hypothetical protein